VPVPTTKTPHSLRRAVLASLVLHAIVAVIARWTVSAPDFGVGTPSLIDIEIAPAPPKAEPLFARAPSQVIPDDTPATDEPHEDDYAMYDAAPPDARRKRQRDAADDEMMAGLDAAIADDATAVAVGGDDASGANAGSGSGDGSGSGSGSGSDVAGIGTGSAGDPTSGDPGDGKATGTSADLIAYFPKGYVVAAMLRFDRIRGTRWQRPTERLFTPMPDHKTLIGDRDLHIGDLFDTFVISSPEPADPTKTTLVARTKINRTKLRDMLDEPETPVAWSAATGGLFGKRGAGKRVHPKDPRQFLSPFVGWIVLAQPGDLRGLLSPAPAGPAGGADLDTAIARVKLPAWLERVKLIEAESGSPTGPALLVTIGGTAKRYDVPDVGLGVTSVPAPQRLTVALEALDNGFLVRGNLRFATDADAKEFVESATSVRQRILDSTMHRKLAERSHLLNAVDGLSFDRRGSGVSYATSLSVSDALGLLDVAGKTLDTYFSAAAAGSP
jgi:hypothetical protein